ncbi:MAG: transposase, partial [Thermoleophilaceae bacterium]|nr:transposase [Thermoleophilaceae bacterium]
MRLVFDSGRPIAHIARDLGIEYESLRQWVRQAEADAGPLGTTPSARSPPRPSERAKPRLAQDPSAYAVDALHAMMQGPNHRVSHPSCQIEALAVDATPTAMWGLTCQWESTLRAV